MLVRPRSCSGAPTYTKLADGSWRVGAPCATFTFTAAEAKKFADLVKPDAPPPPPPPPPAPSRPAITFGRNNVGDGGSGFDASAKRDEFIVAQGFWRTDILRAKEAFPALKLFVYQNVSRTSAPDVAGNYATLLTTAEAHARGWNSGIADAQETWLKFVRPNDPVGYANFALQRVKEKLDASAAAGYPVDGVFLDDFNSHAKAVDGGLPDADMDGLRDEPEDEALWNAWMEEVGSILGPGLKAAGYLSMPNMASFAEYNLQTGGWQERQIQHFTHVFDEFFVTWGGGTFQGPGLIAEAFRLLGVFQDKAVVFCGQTPNGGSEAVSAFALGMELVKTRGYAAHVPNNGAYNAEPWYPVFERAKALGQPVAAAVSMSSGVWTRLFQNGDVRVDLNARTATIDLG